MYYLNSVGLKHSTVRIWFQAIRVYLDWLANWSTLSDDKAEEYRLNRLSRIVKNIIAGASSKNHRLIRTERTTDLGGTDPPTPYQVSHVVPKARASAKVMLKQLLTATTVDAGKLAFINGFISAFICLSHAQRPSLAAEMRLAEFQAAQPITRPDVSVSFTVLVANHKTAYTHTGQISFVNDMYLFIKDYIKLRAKIMAAVGQSRVELLVNSNGKGISDQVPELIARLHKKFGMQKAYTSRDARRSLET